MSPRVRLFRKQDSGWGAPFPANRDGDEMGWGKSGKNGSAGTPRPILRASSCRDGGLAGGGRCGKVEGMKQEDEEK